VTRQLQPGRNPSDAGVALILVLLILALLLTIVAEFAQAMRLEAVTATNFRSALAETWLAEAAYQRATAEILPDALDHELDLNGLLMFRRARLEIPKVPERIDLSAGPRRLSYRLTDESARINLNRASRDVLDRLLQEAGVEKSDRDVIVDSILDWKDPNDEHRLNGAESDYYLALPVPYKSKNADFDSVDELLQVRGVTRALLYGRAEFPGLAEYLTIVGNNAINVNTASPLVLRVLGFAPAEVELLVSRRPYLDLTALPPGLRRGNLRANSDTFRIEAWAGGATPNGRVLTAVVQRQAGPGQPGQRQTGVGRPSGEEVGAGQVRVTPLSWRWSEASRATSAPAAPAPERAKGKS
jgi:general secretion pathway protein K